MTSKNHGPHPRPSRWRRRRLAIGAAVVVVLLAIGVGGAIYQNQYDIREERVKIPHGSQTLDGVLAKPPGSEEPSGLVIFVHGDGPVDATSEGFYRPYWEVFAQAGYASLSWNKSGVAGSEGDWLDQSMDDRAAEVAAAIAWARSRPDIDAGRIGLWGSSQAGWVLPKVAADAPEDVRFIIAQSPAINWVEQGRYNTLAELRAEGASPGEIRAELERGETTLRLLREGASYEEYRQAVGDVRDVTAARWRFISKNYTADATRDLPAMRTTDVMLVLAGQDLNVDVADTEATYRRILTGPGELQVRQYPDATHTLLKKRIEDSQIKLTLTAVFAPRALFTDGHLTNQRRFLAHVNNRRLARPRRFSRQRPGPPRFALDDGPTMTLMDLARTNGPLETAVSMVVGSAALVLRARLAEKRLQGRDIE